MIQKTILTLFIFSIVQLNGLVLSDLSYQGTLEPGETKQVKITLSNDLERAEQIDLKLTDYSCNAEGEHFFDKPGTKTRSNAPWITLSKERLTLAPQEKTDIYLTIDVPKDLSDKGSFWSVLLVEPNEPIQPLQDTKEGYNLKVMVRYAFHIVTTIGEGKVKLKVVDRQIKVIDGKKLLCLDVANQGDLFLNPKLSVKLYTEQGVQEKTLTAQSERLYPGNSQRYFVDLEGLEKKKYKAFILLDNGDKNLFGDTFALDLEGS